MHSAVRDFARGEMGGNLIQVGPSRIHPNHEDVGANEPFIVEEHLLDQTSPQGVNLKNVQSGLIICRRELNLPFNPARPEQGGVQNVDPGGGHDHL